MVFHKNSQSSFFVIAVTWLGVSRCCSVILSITANRQMATQVLIELWVIISLCKGDLWRYKGINLDDAIKNQFWNYKEKIKVFFINNFLHYSASPSLFHQKLWNEPRAANQKWLDLKYDASPRPLNMNMKKKLERQI